MQNQKNMRAIEDINCASIKAEARKLGLKKLELLGKYWHPEHPDSNDFAIEIYQFPGGAKVAATNGDPIWEEQDLQVWGDLMEQYGIETRDVKHPVLYVEHLPISDGDPKYEVIAPDGYHFSEQVHSLLCFSRQDVLDRVAWNDLEPCTEKCG